MIYYDERSWRQLVLRFRGTAWESTWHLVLMTFLLSLFVYLGDLKYDCQIAAEGHTIYASTMSYLLVFRANNASERYWLGRCYLTSLFLGLREFVMGMCITCRGGQSSQAWLTKRASKYTRCKIEDAYDIRASMARVNAIRLVLAFVVSLKLHTRICYNGLLTGRLTSEEKWYVDWYRLRLRCLVTRQEFEELNDLIPIIGEEHVTRGAAYMTPQFLEEALEPPEFDQEYLVDTTPDMRQPLAILFKMWIEITKHMNEPWGFKERFAKEFLGTCHQCSVLFESITMVITTPIPFPYVHLCKCLLVFFLLMTPLVIDPELGLFANVFLPTAVAMSLLGIDAIATELENPFGDDANDLDIVRCIGTLEAECLQMLELSGDHRAKESFTHVQIPLELRGDPDNPREPKLFLCLCSQWRTQERNSGSVSFQDGVADGARHGRVPTEQDDDDPRRPLLNDMNASMTASGQHGFVPMAVFGTDTVELEEGDGGSSKKKKKEAQDNVGLSDDEEDNVEGVSASFMENQMPMSPAPRTAGKPAGQSGSLNMSKEVTMSIGSKGGFRPMGEFGTETVQFAEACDEEELGADVVGLSDDEGELKLSAEVIMEEEWLSEEDFKPLRGDSANSALAASSFLE